VKVQIYRIFILFVSLGIIVQSSNIYSQNKKNLKKKNTSISNKKKKDTNNTTKKVQKKNVIEDEGYIPLQKEMTPEERENAYREAKIKKSSMFSFGVSIGMIPDVGGISDSGPRVRNINYEMSRLVALYNKSVSNAPAGYSSSAEQNSSSKTIYGVPVGFYFYYYTSFFMFRSGFNYTMSTVATNEITVMQSNPNASPGELSGLDTGGSALTIRSEISMSYFEIPLTVTVRLVNVWGSSLYFGGGLSYFVGGWKRQTIKSGGETIKMIGNTPDVDVFFGSTIGYHFIIGGEVFINRDIALTAELTYSFGSVQAEDNVISKSQNTLKTDPNSGLGITDFETLDIGAKGSETGKEISEVTFGGVGVSIGVRYIL